MLFPPSTQEGMALADFMQQFDSDGPFELIEGAIIPMAPQNFGRVTLANRLSMAINLHVSPLRLGEAYVEGTFILTAEDNPQWVKGSRVPDVLFVVAARLAAYKAQNPDWQVRPLALIPDWVIEILSPTDSFAQALKKAALYMADGVKLVWIVDTAEQTVHVSTPDPKTFQVFTAEDTLSGAPVLPEFIITAEALFAD